MSINGTLSFVCRTMGGSGQTNYNQPTMMGPDPQQLAEAFVEKADAARSRNEDELAWGWLQKAMALYRTKRDHRGMAVVGRRLASLQARRGDLRSALEQAERARAAAEKAWSRPDMANIDYVVGAIYCQLGEIEVGLRWLHRSVDMWGELGRVDGQVRAWRRIAHAQAVDGDLEAGLDAWRRCLAVCRHRHDLLGEAEIHAEAARACVNAGRPDVAVIHALAALGRHRHVEHPALADDLVLLVEIQGHLGGSVFRSLVRNQLDESATAMVMGLVDAEHERQHPPKPPGPTDLSVAEMSILRELEDDEFPRDRTASSLDDDDEVTRPSTGNNGMGLTPWPTESDGFWWDETATQHRPLALVTRFGRVIAAMVGALLVFLLVAVFRAFMGG